MMMVEQHDDGALQNDDDDDERAMMIGSWVIRVIYEQCCLQEKTTISIYTPPIIVMHCIKCDARADIQSARFRKK
jgi:hypothetical protein